MQFLSWCTRRVGGLSLIGLLALSYWVLTKEDQLLEESGSHELWQSTGKAKLERFLHPQGSASSSFWSSDIWMLFFAYYSLLIHALVFVFPLRACWAVWDLTRNIKKVARSRQWSSRPVAKARRASTLSLSSCSSAVSVDSSDIDLGSSSDSSVESSEVIHAILIPNYKEDLDILRETLDVLASHPLARDQYDVYLAMEAREIGAEVKAMGIINEFAKRFRGIDFTLHPGNIEGEAPGKSSNLAWAARKASERYEGKVREDVIVTGIDADSHLSANYFSLITSMHFAYPETATTTLYSAPIIFDRNAHRVPALVRVADILWAAAGLSGFYTGSTIGPPTSVYSVALPLVDIVGGWDTDPEAIGEDFHMYLKCFFALNGHLTTRTVLAPVSQCNVSGDSEGLKGAYEGCQARYKQAMRHMWGALDSGYAMRQMSQLWRTRHLTERVFRPLHEKKLPGIEESLIQADHESQIGMSPYETAFCAEVGQQRLESPNWVRIFYLFHRLFEAHFLPVHMCVLVIASAIYLIFAEGKADALHISWTFAVTNVLRVAGFLAVGVYMAFYEKYHEACVTTRETEMKAAGLYEGMQGGFSRRSYRKNYLDYILIPLVAPMFGSIPSIHAQISHFWTLDLVYVVSKKQARQLV